MMPARLETQTAPPVPPMMWARVNAMPRATSLSRLGVWIFGLPSAAIVSGR